MDALAEMLRAIKVDSAIYLNGVFSEPWCVASPGGRKLAPVFGSNGHIIIYHLLSEGRAYCEIDGVERVELEPGDLIALPHGHEHRMGGGRGSAPLSIEKELPAILAHGLELLTVGGSGQAAKFICGYLACDPLLSQAFLGGLPPLIRLNVRDDASGQWLENSLRFSVTQAAAKDPGAAEMLSRLSEVFFVETLRRYQRELPPEQTGWLAGARDPGVGRALTLMHHRHTHPWTIAELAHEVGLSRTVLSERFRRFLGETPMAYLTRWRLRLGARALTSTNHSIGQVAFDVGYESEAAFNRAFKREYGLPPARYRRDQAAVGLRIPDARSKTTKQITP
jgi:AraC-like DNA-binding protein